MKRSPEVFLVMALVRGYVQPVSDAEHELIVQAASSVVFLHVKSKPEVVINIP